MALTPSSTISLSDLNTALGRSATAAISMDDAQVRLIASPATSGVVNLADTRNKNTFNGVITSGLAYDSDGNEIIGYQPGVITGASISGTLYGATVSNFVGTMFRFNATTVGNVIPGGTTGRVRVGLNGVTSGLTSDTLAGSTLFKYPAVVILPYDVGISRPWQIVTPD